MVTKRNENGQQYMVVTISERKGKDCDGRQLYKSTEILCPVGLPPELIGRPPYRTEHERTIAKIAKKRAREEQRETARA